LCVSLFVYIHLVVVDLVVSSSAIDCLERLVSDMTNNWNATKSQIRFSSL